MTVCDADAEVVVLGVLPSSSLTHGHGVVHFDRDSSPPGDAVPIYDTTCRPHPARMSTTTYGHQEARSFGANNFGDDRIGSRLSPAFSAIASALVATGLALIGVLLVWLTASAVDAAPTITALSVAAAAASGLLLVLAAVIGGRPR